MESPLSHLDDDALRDLVRPQCTAAMRLKVEAYLGLSDQARVEASGHAAADSERRRADAWARLLEPGGLWRDRFSEPMRQAIGDAWREHLARGTRREVEDHYRMNCYRGKPRSEYEQRANAFAEMRRAGDMRTSIDIYNELAGLPPRRRSKNGDWVGNKNPHPLFVQALKDLNAFELYSSGKRGGPTGANRRRRETKPVKGLNFNMV